MAIDHDQTFKTLITEFFREFMELFLPDETEAIDFSHVKFLEKELFTDLPSGRQKRLDLVVEVGLKGGGEEWILVHTEFESRRRSNFPRRMYEYYSQLFLRHGKPIVPVALFTDDHKWREPLPSNYTIGVKGQTYVTFKYRQIKLKHMNYRTFMRSENPLAFALMAKMDYSRKEQVKLKAEFLRLITATKVNKARKSLLLEFVDGYMPLELAEQLEWVKLIETQPEYKGVTKMITSFEKRGIEKGVVEGKRQVLVEQLREKFGFVNPLVERRVGEIRSGEKLDSLLKAILHAQSIDDLKI